MYCHDIILSTQCPKASFLCKMHQPRLKGLRSHLFCVPPVLALSLVHNILKLFVRCAPMLLIKLIFGLGIYEIAHVWWLLPGIPSWSTHKMQYKCKKAQGKTDHVRRSSCAFT